MSLFGLADIVLRPRTAWGRDPSAPAIAFGDRVIDYGELADGVRRVAAGLSRLGLRRGDVVAVLLKNRPEYLEAVFAVAHLGGVVVPLNYLLHPHEVEFIVADSGASWIITEPDLLAGAGGCPPPPVGPTRIVVGDEVPTGATAYASLLASDPVGCPPESVSADERLLLQYTSGTTGFPKGAIHTHATVLFNALGQIVDFGVSAADVHFVVPSLSWAAGLHCLTLSTLWRGGTVVLKETGGFDPHDFCATIERHRVTTGMFAPSVLRMVLGSGALDAHDLTSLRLVLSGGEPVSAAEIKEVQARVPGLELNQGYGVSEFPSTMLYLSADDVAEHGGAAGLSSITANVRVVDDAGRVLPAGEHGEIAVRSPQSSSGYHSRTGGETTAVVDGWLRTGDRGYVDEGGFVHVAGRVKEMIVSGGLNVYPAEVERVIATHPAVREAAVVGVPDDRYGEVGHAFVVLNSGTATSQDELTAFVRAELAGFKVPKHWTFRDEDLPRTVTGKVRRFELR
ncbi:MAG: AMP-binding protein [Nocardioides sp.]|uniref:AMP-binding protein n=1 Tax=Nocardioides sp. TaxID=35761 RepID=UPI0039E69A4F